MTAFFHDLSQYALLQHALVAALLASVAAGIVGTYVVVRRITYIAGGISHCVLGGLGAAVYLQQVHGLTWLDPLYGAIAAALLAAGVIGWASLRAKQWEDSIIGAIWAIGMSVGVLFAFATPGYGRLVSYLFGDITLVSRQDLWLLGLLDATVVVVGLGFARQFTAVCFDESFARARGLRVEVWYVLLLMLTALTVVLLVKVVGIVMVIALLTMPGAIAGAFARRMWQMMLGAVSASVLFTTFGQAVAYEPGWPTGPTIVVLAGVTYLLILVIRALLRRGREA